MTSIHRDVAVQAGQHLGISQPFAPVFLQFFQQEFLGIIMLRKRARSAGNFHIFLDPDPIGGQRLRDVYLDVSALLAVVPANALSSNTLCEGRMTELSLDCQKI